MPPHPTTTSPALPHDSASARPSTRVAPAHHVHFVLRQYIEHKNPANLRLHLWTNAITWLSLATVLSQIPLPASLYVPLLGANVGATWTVLSVLYWLPLDAMIPVGIALLTTAWALLPLAPWGPGHGWLLGGAAPLLVFVAMGLTALYAHVYHHEHAEFLKGGSRAREALDTTHAVLWGPFHFTLIASLHAGWRPRLKALLDEREERVLRMREQVPWVNWAKLASCRAQFVCAPRDAAELAAGVREARARRLRIRVVASGFSWSSVATSDDALVFCERMNGITVDTSEPARPTVWADAGVTNRELNRALAQAGLCMPWNVVLETVRIAGIVSTGTHGTGKGSSTVGDLVEALEVVDAHGAVRVLSDETVGPDVMSAARLGLGLFGVIARVKLRVIPMVRVLQNDQRLPVRDVLDRLPALIAAHQSVELYWFPFNRDLWIRTIDPTDAPRTAHAHAFWFKAQNFIQNTWAVLFFTFVTRYAPRLTPPLLRLGFGMLPFHERVLDLPESHHYRHWIEIMPAGCLEVGFKADADCANVRRAWEVTERLVAEHAAQGSYPLNISLNVRFIGSSGALLTPAWGEGITCYIEIMFMGRPARWAEFSSDLCRAWLQVPGALPHWSKEFEHVRDVVSIVRANLGDRRERFLTALAESGIDPERAFWNPVLQRVLLDEVRAS